MSPLPAQHLQVQEREVVAVAGADAAARGRQRLDVGAVVVNRLQPRFTDASGDDIAAAASAASGTTAHPQLALLADLVTLADAEEAQLSPLLDRCAGAGLLEFAHNARRTLDIGRERFFAQR